MHKLLQNLFILLGACATRSFTLSVARGGRLEYVPGQDGTYAQNYQDVWMQNVAQWNGWSSGFFLDLGAFHGLQCSNTALLEKKLGWNGICVEPFPNAFESRRCVLVKRALSDTGGVRVQFDGYGQGRYMTSGSGNAQATTMTIQQLLDCTSANTSAAVQTGVDCSGVAGKIAIPPFINFVSLDIEGAELSVLNGFPWHKIKVGAWVVENAVDGSRNAFKQGEVRRVLREHGYIAAPVQNPGVDEYFVLPQFWDPALAKKEYRIHPPGSGGCF